MSQADTPSGDSFRLPKKLLPVLGVVLILMGVLVAKKPSQAQHEAWLREHYSIPVPTPWEELRANDPKKFEQKRLETLRQRFEYHDEVFYSTMTDNEAGGAVASLGYLGHVGKPFWAGGRG
jgi:hypothetical protein